MRLICPNCGAQYEVSADVIPDGGRDVQCSNCGHTWFEHPDAPSAEAEEDSFVDAAPPPPPPPPPPAPPARTQLDPSIADILREEAAREEEARKAEAAAPLEEQPDLGLTDPPPPPRPRKIDPVSEGRDRIDRLQGRTPAATSPAGAGSRKELFPDIEEINSTLRSSADRDILPPLPAEEADAARRSGRRGFVTMLALIVLLGVIYAYADDIATALPALADPLSSYVALVDAARLWLDAQVQSLLGETATR